MCQQKFGVILKTNILCSDGSNISLFIKRKGLPIIIPIGTHIIFGEYDFEIVSVKASLSFDVITYECDIYESLTNALTNEQITELIIKYKWWKE